jgi:palmitoyl-protein thioesterase
LVPYFLCSYAQKEFAPATYWHDPSLKDVYRSNSTFLAIVNNEATLNTNYKSRIKQLKNLVLVRYEKDTAIIPNESSHFGYENGNNEVVKLKDMEIYKQDRLGLRALDERGGLIFLNSPGTHLQLDKPWFAANVIKYLRDIVVD